MLHTGLVMSASLPSHDTHMGYDGRKTPTHPNMVLSSQEPWTFLFKSN